MRILRVESSVAWDSTPEGSSSGFQWDQHRGQNTGNWGNWLSTKGLVYCSVVFSFSFESLGTASAELSLCLYIYMAGAG